MYKKERKKRKDYNTFGFVFRACLVRKGVCNIFTCAHKARTQGAYAKAFGLL